MTIFHQGPLPEGALFVPLPDTRRKPAAAPLVDRSNNPKLQSVMAQVRAEQALEAERTAAHQARMMALNRKWNEEYARSQRRVLGVTVSDWKWTAFLLGCSVLGYALAQLNPVTAIATMLAIGVVIASIAVWENRR